MAICRDALPAPFGRYTMQRLLGAGGMGSVFLADDQLLHRQVAIKIPRLVDDGSGEVINRLMREARSIAALNHPNICPVYDIGQVNGVHFLAMGYVAGRPLSEYLQANKLQTQRAAAFTVYKIALALEEAHRVGILHRDLKPANIMIDGRGEPIVMDFGLSYRLQDASDRLTQDGTIIGTPAYMAPEQIDNRSPVGVGTDVYSLGVVLYELLTRRRPFQGNVMEVLGQVVHAEPPPVSAVRSDVSPELAAICHKAMAKRVEDRFASMKEFASALLAVLKGKSSTLRIEPLAPLGDLSSVESLLSAAPKHLGSPARTPARQTTPLGVPPAVLWSAAAGIVALGILIWIVSAVLRPGSSSESPKTDVDPIAVATVLTPPPPIPQLAPTPVTETPVAATPKEQASVEPTPVKADVLPPETETVEPAAESQVPEPADVDASPTAPPVIEPESPAADSENSQKPSTPQQEPSEKLPAASSSKDPEQPIDKQFAQFDRNQDGFLDPMEIPLHVIVRADKNNDRRLDQEELRKAAARWKDRLFSPPTAKERRKLPPPGPPPGSPPGRPPR